jgi:hypothetical protein
MGEENRPASKSSHRILRELVYTGYPVLWLKHVIKRASATLIDPAAQLRLLDSLVLLH